MKSKYLYPFVKDSTFRLWGCSAVIGVIICMILFQIGITEGLALSDVQSKQALIAEIPSMRAKMADMGVVNGFLLSGIISGKETPMAVINGHLVKVGDELDGKKVAAITDNSATVCDVVALEKCIQLGL